MIRAAVLVRAGLMTYVPPCSCEAKVHRTCVHHGAEWVRIVDRLERAGL